MVLIDEDGPPSHSRLPRLRSDKAVNSAADLGALYSVRFQNQEAYRKQVWSVLAKYFSRWIPSDSVVLDVGCGYCEFINEVQCSAKFAMDLNPETRKQASADVHILEQDCSLAWPIPPNSLTTVFTSNLLEHLPTKPHVEQTLLQAHDGLRSGGRLIAMGPNAKCISGAYWDFFDHYVALTELSMKEILIKCGFEVEVCLKSFLPYSMSQGRTYPPWMLSVYLALPLIWPLCGKQFLVIAKTRGK
jgi:SAM-dependent methyltransferase